jgi:hypothetical protein
MVMMIMMIIMMMTKMMKENYVVNTKNILYIVIFSAPVQPGPGAHPASYTMRIVSYPEVKRPGRCVDQSLPCNAEVKERVELHFYSPSGTSFSVLGRTLPLPLHNDVKSTGVEIIVLCNVMSWHEDQRLGGT